jgi:hypothetical protein
MSGTCLVTFSRYTLLTVSQCRNHTAIYYEEHTPGGYSDNTPRDYQWWIHPLDRPESMRCNRDNMAWANNTEVLNV